MNRKLWLSYDSLAIGMTRREGWKFIILFTGPTSDRHLKWNIQRINERTKEERNHFTIYLAKMRICQFHFIFFLFFHQRLWMWIYFLFFFLLLTFRSFTLEFSIKLFDLRFSYCLKFKRTKIKSHQELLNITLWKQLPVDRIEAKQINCFSLFPFNNSIVFSSTVFFLFCYCRMEKQCFKCKQKTTENDCIFIFPFDFPTELIP